MPHNYLIHAPTFPEEFTGAGDKGTPFGGYTIAYSVVDYEFSIKIAVAFCNRTDMYSKKRGAALANLLLAQGTPEVDVHTVQTRELAPNFLELSVRASAFKVHFMRLAVAEYVAHNLDDFRDCARDLSSVRAHLARKVIDAVPGKMPYHKPTQLDQEPIGAEELGLDDAVAVAPVDTVDIGTYVTDLDGNPMQFKDQ